jgi:hypothetical protein
MSIHRAHLRAVYQMDISHHDYANPRYSAHPFKDHSVSPLYKINIIHCLAHEIYDIMRTMSNEEQSWGGRGHDAG